MNDGKLSIGHKIYFFGGLERLLTAVDKIEITPRQTLSIWEE